MPKYLHAIHQVIFFKTRTIKNWITAIGICLLSVSVPISFVSAAGISVEIDGEKPGAVINPNIYGQFAEHLGRGIYEGIWVGEDSKIPNIRGYRTDVVEALKAIQVPLVRWPGGCFADEYHWRDGIGPREKRPVKVNTHWGGVEETNAFGTHEFFEFAELIGAQTYVNGNLGTGSPQEMAEWMEYITSDTRSTLANERRRNGRDKPWKLDYFAIGNESWGCGGHMRPEYYADLYRHFATFLKAPHGSRPKLIASGGNDNDTVWTDVLSRQIKGNMDAISFHYYTLPTGIWQNKGAATGFEEQEWISALRNTLKMDDFIRANKRVLDKNDPEKHLGFYVDEWGTWYSPQPGRNPGFLYQQNTLRDAVVAAVNFNIFHAHADRVHMTNIAQMINVLQAMILTDKEKMLLTPTYHTYGMYAVFQNATSLPLKIKHQKKYRFGKMNVPALSASAARGKDGKLYVALVNLDPNQSQNIDLSLKGTSVTEAQGQVLTAAAMDAHNSFSAPETVKPADYRVVAKSGKLTLKIPAKAVVVVAVK